MKMKFNGRLFMLAVLLNGSAYADPEDSWNLVAGTSLMRDSNLFKARSGLEQVDEIGTATLGFKINKAYSLQRFIVDSTVTDNVYRNNTGLNHTTKNLKTNWMWSLTPQLHGNLSSDHTESLASFVDFGNVGKNIRKTDTERFDAEWEVFGPIRLLSAASHTTQKSTASLTPEGDYKADAAELGAKYVFPSGATFTLLDRETDGKYNRVANFGAKLDSGFKQSDQEARFVWLPSGKSRFNGRVTWLERKHENFTERDYKGTAGTLDYNWTVSGKFAITLGWQRDLSAWTAPDASYYIRQGFSVTPVWQVSGKTAIRARYSDETRTYQGALTGISVRAPEKFKTAMVSVEWSPLRTLAFSAMYQHSSRDTDGSDRDFKANVGMVSANLVF